MSPRHQMIASATEFCPNPCWIWRSRISGGFHMASRRTELAIERIIAACDGNMSGAVEALLLVNEQLESELQRLYEMISLIGDTEECIETVH
jgi:hypothetical protein